MEQNQGCSAGSNTLERIKQILNAPIKVNSEFKMPKIRIHENASSREFFCTCCGKGYQRQDGNFLRAGNSILWQGNNGYMPICKSCAETIFNAYVDFYSGNEEHALRHWCGIFDYPYDLEASAMTAVHVQPGRSRVALYPSKLNTKQVRSRGVNYLDTVRNETGDANRIRSIKDVEVFHNNEEKKFTITESVVKKWGYGHKPEEYEWLEEQEEDWRSHVECKSKVQGELIRAICISQLNIRNAQQSGGKVTEAMKAFQDLLASCNLQPRQNANDDFADQNTFGTLIKQFEQEKPIPQADPEWEDVDGIKKYIDTFFLGHLCKLVHIDNDCSEAYTKAINENTVKPPTYESDDDSADLSLLEKYSDKGEKKE